MQPGQVVALLVLAFAVFFAWSVSRGRTLGVPLYALSVVIPASLLAGTVAQLFDARGAIEAFNVTAIALSLATLPSDATLWEEELQADLRRMRLVHPLRARDLLSWRGWLKLVDRVGARGAAAVYIGIYAVAVGAALGTAVGVGSSDGTIYSIVPFLAPTAFALFSASRIYRGVRRLVPGA